MRGVAFGSFPDWRPPPKSEAELIQDIGDDIKRMVEVMAVGESVTIERKAYEVGKPLFTVTTKGFE